MFARFPLERSTRQRTWSARISRLMEDRRMNSPRRNARWRFLTQPSRFRRGRQGVCHPREANLRTFFVNMPDFVIPGR